MHLKKVIHNLQSLWRCIDSLTFFFGLAKIKCHSKECTTSIQKNRNKIGYQQLYSEPDNNEQKQI